MEKDDGRVCKICNKCFPSRNAVGGHMRSHLVKLPIIPKPETKNQTPDNSAKITTGPIQSPSALNFHPKPNPTQNFQSFKHRLFGFFVNSQNENEYLPFPKNPTRKRSKRYCYYFAEAEKKSELKPVSLMSETLSAEEAARSLLMMSKDKWPANKKIKTPNMVEAKKIEAKDDGNGREAASLVQNCTQVRLKCKMCPEMFQSDQALGEHKANQKRIDSGSGSSSGLVDQKVVKCPHCFKGFKSAQALGGHKKVHLNNPIIANAHTTANKFDGKSPDLNFPASKEDEEIKPN